MTAEGCSNYIGHGQGGFRQIKTGKLSKAGVFDWIQFRGLFTRIVNASKLYLREMAAELRSARNKNDLNESRGKKGAALRGRGPGKRLP